MKQAIVVTGMGLDTCVGLGVEETWRRLSAGATGLRPIRRFDVSEYRVTQGGEAPLPRKGDAAHDDGLDRATLHLEGVVAEALRSAGFADGRTTSDKERTALVLGSSLAASDSSRRFWHGYLGADPENADYAALKSYCADPLLRAVSERFGVEGDSLLVSNACAAGASALALGASLLRRRRADFVIAGGFDTLELHTFAGFHSLGALSAGPMRPFAADRSGMSLSDGFGVVLLEREEDASRAGRAALARLLGFGESSDAHNITQPHPEGKGAALAMRRALAMAGLEPSEIEYVNLHATATPSNDASEYRAMRDVFGEAGLRSLLLHATKPSLGHSLGGAGAVEAVIAILVLLHQRVPPSPAPIEPEGEMAGLVFADAGARARIRHAMTNSFGFGGCNTSLVFGTAKS